MLSTKPEKEPLGEYVMLNITDLLGGPARRARGTRPVVVWNITGACGLRCLHCYSKAGAADERELSTDEALVAIDGLSDYGVHALIFSGGDPLERSDLMELVSHASKRSLKAAISTSGVTLDTETAKRLKDAGASYIGVSLEGDEEANDAIRGKGSFRRALEGIRASVRTGIPTGLRLTLTRLNIGGLPFIFRLVEEEGVGRLYFSHLVYSGRGRRKDAPGNAETRRAVDSIIGAAVDFLERSVPSEIVTGSNEADGVCLYLKTRERDPAMAQSIYAGLVTRGGNTSGVGICSIDRRGFVHPDQFWSTHSFGNVRERPFGEIWEGNDALKTALRKRTGLIKGRCAACIHFDACNGNSRQRALAETGDPFGEDPACYLTDAEVFGRRR